MKHFFTLISQPLSRAPWVEHVPETTEVLLTGQPFDDQVRVFAPIGYLSRSEDLATKIGTYVHGRRWGRITRNDGHYIEIETEEHDDAARNNPST